jgi:hypothetical protein
MLAPSGSLYDMRIAEAYSIAGKFMLEVLKPGEEIVDEPQNLI